MIPATAGMVSVAYHLPETPGQLRLTREAVAGIFAGDIDSWDDPRIAQSNPDLALPSRTIAVVARLDGSGTTFAFANFLSAVSEAWRTTHGAATRIDWPKRAMLAPGNEGVAARILQSYDAIGYVEYGFASRLGLAQAAIENRSGEFVLPSQASGEAAVAGSADLFPEDLRLFIADPPGAGAYPITTFSWLLLYATYGDPAVREAVAEFVRFGLTEGQAMAAELGFLPLAPAVADRGMRALESLT
jgi:phosphate transport system substrate-binding protein